MIPTFGDVKQHLEKLEHEKVKYSGDDIANFFRVPEAERDEFRKQFDSVVKFRASENGSRPNGQATAREVQAAQNTSPQSERAPDTASSEQKPAAGFAQRALPMIEHGVPVVPLRPKTKIAFFNNWPDLATTDAAQIKQWAEDYPDANCAPVAKAQLNGVWFLEFDKSNVYQVIQEQTGHKIPETFTVHSSPGRGHLYFRQTAASIAMGNRQGKDENGKEAWSARVDNRYVVGPLSIHPNGGVYEISRDVPIVEAPDWLIEWCIKNDANSKVGTKKTGDAELDSEEPISDISEGSRNNTLISILGRARQVLGMDKDELFEFGKSVNSKRCRPPLSETEVRTIANSAGKYEVKKPGEFIISGSQPQPTTQPDERPIETEPVNPSEASADSLDWLPLSVLASTRLQDIFIKYFMDEWPLTLALPSLVTAASVVMPPHRDNLGLVLGDSSTNLYTALIADLGVGKSQIIEWACRAIGIYNSPVGSHYFEGKWGSAEQLLKSLHKKQSSFTSKSVLINPDEWSHLFAKAAIPDASFPSVLTTAFYRRRHFFTLGGQGGGREYELDLAMSFIGGIVEQDFDTVFGVNTLGGLYDRFLFGHASDGFKWNYSPCPIEPKEHWKDWNLKGVQIDGSVWEVLKAWNRENPAIGRIAEICSRVAIIYATLDGRPEVTGKDIEPLKSLALYQVGLRQVFKPNPGQSPDAIFANKALAWIQKYAKDWMSIAKLKQHTWRVEQELGPQVAVRSLISLWRSGRIDLWLPDPHDLDNKLPADYKGPRPRIGLVRRVK